MSSPETLKPLTVRILTAYLSRNPLPVTEVTHLLRLLHASLLECRTQAPLAEGAGAPAPAGMDQPVPTPAVPISKSITPTRLICLEDGVPRKMLKRYLKTKYKMTPEEYRRRWNLPADYPMTAPAYSQTRSSLARASGLGQRGNARNGGGGGSDAGTPGEG